MKRNTITKIGDFTTICQIAQARQEMNNKIAKINSRTFIVYYFNWLDTITPYKNHAKSIILQNQNFQI